MIQHKTKSVFSTLAVVFLIIGCTSKPEKIFPGKDNCAECKMVIMDPKFAAEIVTKKGKIYKFDDVHCVATFIEERSIEMSDIQHTLFVDYNNGIDFIAVADAEFVVSSQFKSPMGGNAAACKNKEAAEKVAAQLEGSKVTNWATLYNILVK